MAYCEGCPFNVPTTGVETKGTQSFNVECSPDQTQPINPSMPSGIELAVQQAGKNFTYDGGYCHRGHGNFKVRPA